MVKVIFDVYINDILSHLEWIYFKPQCLIMRMKAWYVIGYVKLGKVYCTYILHLVTHVLLHSKPESNT